jgi:hypothetical protein
MPENKDNNRHLSKNIFTFGLDNIGDIEIKRKEILISILSLIGIINLIPLGFDVIAKNKLTLGLFDFTVSGVIIIRIKDNCRSNLEYSSKALPAAADRLFIF